MPVILWILIAAAALIAGFFIGFGYRKKVAEREISSAEEEAKRIINESIKSAESKKREALLEAKEEIHKSRSEYEREVKERRAELTKQERRYQQKEENLDRKLDAVEKKNDVLSSKIAAVEALGEMNRRIRDMGLIPGTTVSIVGRAPLKDPVALRLSGVTISLRNSEADYIKVDLSGAAG